MGFLGLPYGKVRIYIEYLFKIKLEFIRVILGFELGKFKECEIPPIKDLQNLFRIKLEFIYALN